MSSVIDDTDVIQYMSIDEGRALLDRRARAFLGISGEEFIRRYIANDLADLDPSSVSSLYHDLPLAGVLQDAWKPRRRVVQERA